jgi:hypothetical protein
MMFRALGGGELKGEKLVRFAYLDESGTGNPKEEPFIIVAGFVVHADKQLKDLEKYLMTMADSFATHEDRPSFYFHAHELFTGGKNEFRDKYSLKKRHEFLLHLCEIPQKFNLPIFAHAVDRASLAKKKPSAKNKELLIEGLQHASMACAQGIEMFMQKHADPDEIATLIYEQNGNFSKHVKAYHNLFRSRVISEIIAYYQLNNLKPFERIAETAFFADKEDSSALQVADACAYILNRHMRQKTDIDNFLAPIMGQLVYGMKAWQVKVDLAS